MQSYLFLKNGLQLTCKYITHWLKGKSKSGHGIHSPFVYDFVRKVVRPAMPDNTAIEAIRRKNKKSADKIFTSGFGAGSSIHKRKKQSVRWIATHATKKKVNKLLFRIVQYTKPDFIIELGTSLGFSTMYMAEATDNEIYTVEGDKAIAAQANKNFNLLDIKNIELMNTTFDEALPEILKKESGKALIFIDGDHTYEATLKYFNDVFKHLPEGSVLIFDDINWSNGMQAAWQEIVVKENIPLTLDLFYLGIVFVNKNYYKQHFTVKF